ncbi:MAG: hypothetical protein IKZ88_08335 [Neisseriaceae bacterium]|nr:hypothetical protein [Neisseriaceae bacterium]
MNITVASLAKQGVATQFLPTIIRQGEITQYGFGLNRVQKNPLAQRD